jgi:hypothetical protein
MINRIHSGPVLEGVLLEPDQVSAADQFGALLVKGAGG